MGIGYIKNVKIVVKTVLKFLLYSTVDDYFILLSKQAGFVFWSTKLFYCYRCIFNHINCMSHIILKF